MRSKVHPGDWRPPGCSGPASRNELRDHRKWSSGSPGDRTEADATPGSPRDAEADPSARCARWRRRNPVDGTQRGRRVRQDDARALVVYRASRARHLDHARPRRRRSGTAVDAPGNGRRATGSRAWKRCHGCNWHPWCPGRSRRRRADERPREARSPRDDCARRPPHRWKRRFAAIPSARDRARTRERTRARVDAH